MWTPELALTLLLCTATGLSLGLVGGGGSILTVPILVYVAGLAPREAVAEIERVIASHPTQPLQGSGAGDAGQDRSEHGSMGGTGGGHGLAGQYRGPERHPQSAYHPGASHSQAGQQGAPHAGGGAEDRSRMTSSDRPGAGGSSGGSDRPGGGSGSRES